MPIRKKAAKQQQPPPKKPTKKQPPPPAAKIAKKKKNKRTPKKKKLPKKQIQTPLHDSDTDSSSSSSDSDIQTLLEPYTKDQLTDLLIPAALADPDLLARINLAADADLTHRKIFVFGLGWDTTRDALFQAFQPYGDIDECNAVTDRITGKAKGYGFVLFRTRQAAIRALKDPKKVIGSRTASCQLASAGPPPRQKAAADGSNAAAPPSAPAPAAVQQNVALLGQSPYLNSSLNPNLGLGLFPQNPSFNPSFSPSLGLYGQYPSLAMGMGPMGGYGGQMGNFGGGNQSLLGAYGSGGPMQMGMQYAYPGSQIRQGSSAVNAKAPEAGGSRSGHPS